MLETCGARDQVRTGDPNLGKVVLYRLSYSRIKEWTRAQRAVFSETEGPFLKSIRSSGGWNRTNLVMAYETIVCTSSSSPRYEPPVGFEPTTR